MAELGAASSSPLPFEILWLWQVDDCHTLEQNVHKALRAYRVRDSREFFHIELRVVIETVERLLKC